MGRLLGRGHASPNDPELFSGLTQVCRYCGLLEESLAADRLARRLDPQVRTSVAHTLFVLGDYSAVPAYSSGGGDCLGIIPVALFQSGREPDAINMLRTTIKQQWPLPVICCIGESNLALLEGRLEDSVREAEHFLASCRDPESFYYFARQFAFVGKPERAIELLKEALTRGYVWFSAAARDPWMDPLRANPDFAALRRDAEARYRAAAEAFATAGGASIIGIVPS